MASADDDDHNCEFQWEILYPFVPWREQNAAFFAGTPHVTRWKVTLRRLERRINSYKFQFRLQFDPTFHEEREIVAERVQVSVCMNGSDVGERQVSDYLFRLGRFLEYRFTAYMRSPIGLDVLVVNIKLRLPGNPAVNQYPNRPEDQRCLVTDFCQLLTVPIYNDMKLVSSDNCVFYVHSYIIDERWNNFFIMQDVPRDFFVHINISTGTLIVLLTYLYSGILGVFWPNMPNQLNVAELSQVIDKYHLHHLYKATVADDLHQKRVSRKYVILQTYVFPLQFARRNIPYSHTLNLNQNTELGFVFSLNEQRLNGGWLSYSLESRSPIIVYVQVNLEIKQKVVHAGRTVSERTTNVLESYHTILPSGVVESGAVIFVASPPALGDDNSDLPQTEYSARCTLKSTDGKAIDVIQSTTNEFRDNRENFDILCDHLFNLRESQSYAELQVIPEALAAENYNFNIHKAIFATRVRDWWRILHVQPTTPMPDVWVSNLSEETLNFALDYIYTSRAAPIPYDHLDQITRFARVGACYSLENHVTNFFYGYDWNFSDDDD